MAIHEAVKATLHDIRQQFADRPHGGIDFTEFQLDVGVSAGEAQAVRALIDLLADQFRGLCLEIRACKTEAGACVAGDTETMKVFDGFE